MTPGPHLFRLLKFTLSAEKSNMQNHRSSVLMATGKPCCLDFRGIDLSSYVVMFNMFSLSSCTGGCVMGLITKPTTGIKINMKFFFTINIQHVELLTCIDVPQKDSRNKHVKVIHC